MISIPIYQIIIIWFFLNLIIIKAISKSVNVSIPIRCDEDSFNCVSDGLCIPNSWKCDGDRDCLDGSDEKDCLLNKIVCDPNTEFHCEKSKILQYREESISFFTSMSQYTRFRKCIPKKFHCDGHVDCENGEDEENCPVYECHNGSFKCSQYHNDISTCVPNSWKCDGTQDCTDGSDEKNCSSIIQCDENQFTCKKTSQCIFKKWVCDGEKDCDDGSDEENCKSVCNSATHFQCHDGSHCLPNNLKCDGFSDCKDHSDEEGCVHFHSFREKVCGPNEFSCSGHSRCISLLWKCDGDVDCADGSDEKDCEEKTCTDKERKCDGICKNKDLWCNGVVDCNDGSDELHCNYPQHMSTNCDITTQYQCNNNSKTCINYEDLCKTDSAAFNCNPSICNKDIYSCEKYSRNCKCRNTKYNGTICYCEKGYELIGNKCIDIDECKTEGICDQLCFNKPGSYECDCFKDFQLVPVNNITTIPHKCRALGSDPLLLLANRGSIKQYDMVKNTSTPLISSLTSVVAMDYWHKHGIIVWTDLVKEIIAACQIKDRESVFNIKKCDDEEKTILLRNVSSGDGLAIDWTHGLLFWTDSFKKEIGVLDIATKKSKILFNTSIDEPRAIVADPASGTIFWTDWGKEAKIERAGMDGHHRTTIVSGEYIKWPNGLAIDILNKRLYFADAKLKSISSCDYWGDNIKTIIHSHDQLKHPFSLAVFEEKIYWSDWDKDGVFNANKFYGNDITGILRYISAPMTIKIYHETFQPDYPNKCTIHRCKDLCLPKTHYRSNVNNQRNIFDELPFTCACSSKSIYKENDCVFNLYNYNSSRESAKGFISIGAIVIVILFGISFIGLYIVRNRRQRFSNQFIKFTNPVYRTTVKEGLHDYDDFSEHVDVNIEKNDLNCENIYEPNLEQENNENVCHAFSNPSYEDTHA
uniref:EGF-like domain-containing protein n=1 Tax=Parastrongyloides trichosuri TaxID=131310 RepID=A0A0N4ZHD7_PARTI